MPHPTPHPASLHQASLNPDSLNPDSLLARKLNSFLPLTAHELACLAALQSEPVRVKQGGELVYEGQTGHKAYILQAGWACSFKLLPDGGRQIIRFPLPGDCVGLRSVLLRTSDHSFSALTDVVVSSVDTTNMLRVFNEFPRLGAAILWAASRDEAMVVEHLVIVDANMFRIMSDLVAGRLHPEEARIQDFKPAPSAGRDALVAFAQLVEQFAASVPRWPRLHTACRHVHPWFGALDAHGWLCLAGLHHGIHRRQLSAS